MRHPPHMEPRLNDLQVYQRLLATVEDLNVLADRCHSVAASTAIKTTAKIIRACASGLYRHSLAEPNGE